MDHRGGVRCNGAAFFEVRELHQSLQPGRKCRRSFGAASQRKQSFMTGDPFLKEQDR